LIFGSDTLSIKGGISANNGLSLLNSNVQLGQTVGAVGSPAALLEHREIPTNGFNTVFTGNGKIGIGTNSPVQSLSVNGSFGVTSANGYISSLAGGYPATAYVSQTGGNWGLTVQRHTANVGAPILSFFKNRSNDPNVKLAVQKGDGMGSISFHGIAGNNNTVHFPAEILFTADSIIATQLRGYFTFWTTSWSGSYGERLRISANGNVTIGNGNAEDRLLVQGTGRINDTLKLPNIISKSDTSLYKPMAVDANGNVFKMTNWNLGTRKSTTVTGSSYTVPADIDVVFVNYTAGQATITLPAGIVDREITIKNLSTSNTVILSGLDTNESNSIATRGAITVKYTGDSWVGIGKY
jgi:hypothetical protein